MGGACSTCACFDDKNANTMLLSSREPTEKEIDGVLLDFGREERRELKGELKSIEPREETRASKIELFNEFNELDEFTIPVRI
jgi:hypothetical protein